MRKPASGVVDECVCTDITAPEFFCTHCGERPGLCVWLKLRLCKSGDEGRMRMSKRLDAIAEVLKGMDFCCEKYRIGLQEELMVERNLSGNKPYTVEFITREDAEAVHVLVNQLLSGLTEEQRVQILPAMNELNMKYRFFRLHCDSDGDVSVRYDFPDTTSTTEDCASELLFALDLYLKKAYPVLCQAAACED